MSLGTLRSVSEVGLWTAAGGTAQELLACDRPVPDAVGPSFYFYRNKDCWYTHILELLDNCCIERVDELAIFFEVTCEVMIMIYMCHWFLSIAICALFT